MATSKKRLRELIEEGLVDCYDEGEQHIGMLTMVQENLACPFPAKVIGEKVTVVELAWLRSDNGLVAVCERGGQQYRVEITSLEFIKPYPEGYEWIEAYLLWRGNLDEDDLEEE